jgi:GDPmannose 4,6-dehydratase
LSKTIDNRPARRRALITGITGQDGSYLTELLLAQNYEVHGTSRDSELEAKRRLWGIANIAAPERSQVTIHCVDLRDSEQILSLVARLQPDEIFHLGAQSHVGMSFESPFETLDANARGTLAILESARRLNDSKPVRVYQASTSELFGVPRETPQTESTPFHPRNPYACSKAYAYDVAICYREAYGLFVCNGILYNHESPRRGVRYVTRKITQAAARIAAGLQDHLELGRLDVGRDWGYAPEYVEAMWKILQQPSAENYIIATNQWHPLTEFLDIAFRHVNLDWRDFVRTDEHLLRPAETGRLQGDFSKAKQQLGWSPRTSFESLVQLMVDADLSLVRGEPARV